MLVLGIYSRAVAVAMIRLLLGTIYAVHGSAGLFFAKPNGGGESLWMVGLVSVALIGSAAYALRLTPSTSNHQAAWR